MSEHEILEAMRLLGGGFVQQLAVLYRQGDQMNRAKLRATFANYFEEYEEIARLKYEREHQT